MTDPRPEASSPGRARALAIAHIADWLAQAGELDPAEKRGACSWVVLACAPLTDALGASANWTAQRPQRPTAHQIGALAIAAAQVLRANRALRDGQPTVAQLLDELIAHYDAPARPAGGTQLARRIRADVAGVLTELSGWAQLANAAEHGPSEQRPQARGYLPTACQLLAARLARLLADVISLRAELKAPPSTQAA